MNKEGALHIRDIQHSDSGNYTCYVENTHGKDDIVYTIHVRGKLKPISRGIKVKLPFERSMMNVLEHI